MASSDATNFVAQERTEDDLIRFTCMTCENTVLAADIDAHAGRAGHNTGFMRTFSTKRAYEKWVDEQARDQAIRAWKP